MDLASILGLLIAFVMIAGSVMLSGGSLTSYWDTPALLMVGGGTLGAVIICFSTRSLLRLPRVLLKAFYNRPVNQVELVREMVRLAEVARREGLLALEPRLATIDDPFMRLGVQMAVDGTRPEIIEEILKTEMDAVALRHRDGKKMVDQIGRFGPAFGMIGTLLGLITMLGNLTDPSAIGSGMAVALITTLYGAVLSNAMFLPFSEKLAAISKQEMIGREIVLRGVLAIQQGENPRIVEQKLSIFLPAGMRASSEVF